MYKHERKQHQSGSKVNTIRKNLLDDAARQLEIQNILNLVNDFDLNSPLYKKSSFNDDTKQHISTHHIEKKKINEIYDQFIEAATTDEHTFLSSLEQFKD